MRFFHLDLFVFSGRAFWGHTGSQRGCCDVASHSARCGGRSQNEKSEAYAFWHDADDRQSRFHDATRKLSPKDFWSRWWWWRKKSYSLLLSPFFFTINQKTSQEPEKKTLTRLEMWKRKKNNNVKKKEYSETGFFPRIQSNWIQLRLGEGAAERENGPFRIDG